MPDSREPEAASEARYKIGEVCRLADVQPYVLRYWENEFPVLAGERGQPGPRSYSEQDLKVIQRIKTLLYVEGFTIAGAKKRLESELRAGEAAGSQSDTAPVPALQPDAAPAPEPRPRRSRTRPIGSAREPELPEIFEETVGEGEEERAERAELPAEAVPSMTAPIPRPARAKDPSTGVVDPRPGRPDPRLARAVKELREILQILSREP